jgi:hypothetical protein
LSGNIVSAGALSRLWPVLVGLIVLAGCGGGSSTSSTGSGTPAVTLSPTSLTFSSAVGVASAAQTVTITNSGTASLTFSSFTLSSTTFSETNTCGTGIAESGTCTISVTFTPTSTTTVTGTLTLTDNAGNSPQTVSLTGTGTSASLSPTSISFTGVAVGTSSAAQSVTLTNASNNALTITSIAATTGFSETNTCGSSLAANGTCSISVVFSPTASGTITGTLTVVDGAGTQTVSLTGTNSFANTAQVTVGFGPNGNTENPETNYYNNIYTTVTVCEPGTTTCQSINNVLVDTGSVGLRILASQLTSVSLKSITDTDGDALNECVEFGTLDYTWGPVAMATVQIGGETASQVPTASGGTANSGIPIQIISNTSSVPNGAECTQDGGSNENTVALLGSNGLLGIGNFPQDCVEGGTNYCTSSSSDELYIVCSNSSCAYASVPVQDQVWNPVAAFSSSDTNGLSLYLPAIPATGAANNAVTGTLTFGIGTESNNVIPSTANLYQLDEYGYFGSATFAGVTYTSASSYGSFLDSGSNGLFVSDYSTLSAALKTTVSDCTYDNADIYYYCPSSTLTVPLTVAGTNGTSTTVDLSIANALSLFSSGNSTFNNLGGESGGTGASTDSWDLGLPFFFGKTIFFGISGTTVGSVTSTDGYYAF